MDIEAKDFNKDNIEDVISVDTNCTTELQKFGKSGSGKRRYGQVSGFRGGTGKKSRGEESFPPPKNFSLRTKTLKILKFISKKKNLSSCQKKSSSLKNLSRS